MKTLYNRYNCHYWIFILLVCAQSAAALPFRFMHYMTDQGIPSNRITAFTQDTEGFMWIGTDNGLCRFNGYNFRTFTTQPNDSTSIGSNYLTTLYEDSQQTLWVGTDRGVYIYNKEQERFRRLFCRDSRQKEIHDEITSIIEDRQGIIWISTQTQGLFAYDREADTLRSFTNQEADGLCSNAISKLFIDHTGRLWAFSHTIGCPLCYYNPAQKRFERLPIHAKPEISKSISIYAAAEDEEGILWLGTWANGICRLDTKTGELTSYLQPRIKGGVLHVHDMQFYKPGILLISSDDGLVSFNTTTYEPTYMTQTELEKDCLSDQFAYPIYRDREGGLWVGTYYGGINYSSPPKAHIEGFSHSIFRNSVGGDIVSRFVEDAEGNIWIGTDDGGLSFFNTQTRQFTNYRPEIGHNSLSYHNIHALLLDGESLWIGTYSVGLDRLDLRSKQFKHYQKDIDDPKSLEDNSIYALFKDHEGTVWIGSMQGISCYNRAEDSFFSVQRTDVTTCDITEDKQHRLWFATHGKGLLRYDRQTEQWTNFRHTDNDPHSLPEDNVNCLYQQEDRLWIGTENGICYYDFEKEQIEAFPTEIPSMLIRSLVATDEWLWIGTPAGLVAYPLMAKQHPRFFFTNDGLQSNQLNQNAILLTSKGDLYIGTTDGFNIIRPTDLTANEYQPPIVITRIQLFNQTQQIQPEGILQKAPNYTERIELAYNQNVIGIEYAALSYSDPSRNVYQYKLEGFDKDWNRVDNRRRATYTNLPPGTYTLRIEAANSDGYWNNQGKTLRIIVHPPFWRTTWAYTLYGIMIMGLIYFIIDWNRQRTEHRINQMKIEQEKKLYAAKIGFFTMVTHEIRTPLSLIIGPLEKIMSQLNILPDNTHNDLNTINRNCQRLLLLVNQLLDFRKAEQNAFTFTIAKCSVSEMLQNLFVRFQPMAEQRNLSLTMDEIPPTLTAELYEEGVTKIVSNLLTNAMKFAKSQIEIHCRADEERGLLHLSVTDDGIGISAEEQKKIFLPFYQVPHTQAGTGLGLSLVKLLTDAHHGTIQLDSTLGSGTTFTISLPLKQGDSENLEKEQQKEIKLPDAIEPDSPSVTEQQPTPQEKTGYTLLIVEDNAELCSFLADNFSSRYQVFTASNGKEALHQLLSHQINLIISDIMMPEMDGLTFCKKVKSDLAYSHIPIILLTAKTDQDAKLSGIRNGADIYLEKPFSLQLLQARVENLLQTRRALWQKYKEHPLVPIDSIAESDADKAFLTQMNEVIERNFSNVEFNISMLAEEMRISRSGFFAKIKNLTDTTPNELIQIVRLKKAAGLLSSQKLRINEICYRVGFSNPSYFAKCFQKQFGMTPREYMLKYNLPEPEAPAPTTAAPKKARKSKKGQSSK